ncbi:MAG TPA: hypothetical protein VNM37_25520 [Candidatus Dormibacteraeota bacterium]|nr:hypothetical protein [Candidatus Dormibacteraeota bacterium]
MVPNTSLAIDLAFGRSSHVAVRREESLVEIKPLSHYVYARHVIDG